MPARPPRPHEEETVGDIKVQLIDDHVDWPYDFFDGIKLIQFHRSYGDKHGFENPEAVVAAAAIEKAKLIPLFLYEHGNVQYSIKDRRCWDTCRVGFIWLDHAYVEELAKYRGFPIGSPSLERVIEESMKALLEEYSAFCNGETYSIRTVPLEPTGKEAGEDDFQGPIYGYSQALKDFNSVVEGLKNPEQLPQPPLLIAGNTGLQAFI